MHPSQPAPDPHRALVNRQNAARSTGPVTPEGKRRVVLNALRHGLTGQTIVLPGDDLVAYQNACAHIFAELKPQGLLETRAIQAIADTLWRLDRIRAMESNLFSLGVQEYTGTLSPDPEIHCVLAQAKALDHRADLFARLSLYEQRLNRTLAQAKTELRKLQRRRAKSRKEAFQSAAQVHNLKEALDQPWQPEQSGFEFSNRELADWILHRDLLRQAEDFDIHRRLPSGAGPRPAAAP